ncbi:DMSO/TMAO reductase YedYZ molybdopterin-dependent catalytic subunit [Agromyces terreus]|uniref:DMSO/TMAO reductase YedYZ molybdopterin-dependent catalytic subunit n=1 Tax=Agromyces terreus TaxID=424795 RepID=A0A9X2H1F0_9MICO|nr:molybdopterin-dependent oxidoreductase [Agromyces terreus]MCP2370818.1 DMSO/TMAO reductase YedYZ molybdopterin-dependent catalytic subunit [Agromyces terreus]
MPARTPAARLLFPALAGVAAAVVAAGAGTLAAALLASDASPFAVVGAALIDLAPPWAKDAAIALFGTNDKAALLTGVAIVLLVIAGAAGVLESRRPPWGQVVFWVLGGVGVLAAVTRANASMLAFAPSAIAAVAGVLVLRLLVRRLAAVDAGPSAADGPDEPDVAASTSASGPPAARQVPDAAGTRTPEATAVDRRRFLAWAGGATAVGLIAAWGGYAMQAGSRAVTAVREAITLPRPTSAASVPQGAELGIDGLAPVITPNAEFYRIDTALVVPSVEPADWSLRIHGDVEREVVLTWDELLALPLAESVTTLACVSNEVGGGLIGNAVWLGYPIRELLAQAAPGADADMVLSRSIDGFTASTPLEVLQDDAREAILAVGMNGEPLPPEHGFPVRMVVPGLYGYVSATKWVTELEVTRFDAASAYWTDRGWSDHGPIKLSSRIDVPRSGQPLSAGPVVVAGVAWHQHVGVAAVDVQVDDGPWRPATRATAISDDTWVQWRFEWDAAAGSHSLRVRATGADGEVQTSRQQGVVPDGATGLHERTVTVS